MSKLHDLGYSHHGKYSNPGAGDYQQAIDATQQSPFQFQPDMQDPILSIIDSHAKAAGAERQRNNLNEIARGGLLGSSAAFSTLQGNDLATERLIEESRSNAFGAQRDQQLRDREMRQHFLEQLQLMRLQAMLAKQNRPGMDLSGLGELAGTFGPALFGLDRTKTYPEYPQDPSTPSF